MIDAYGLPPTMGAWIADDAENAGRLARCRPRLLLKP